MECQPSWQHDRNLSRPAKTGVLIICEDLNEIRPFSDWFTRGPDISVPIYWPVVTRAIATENAVGRGALIRFMDCFPSFTPLPDLEIDLFDTIRFGEFLSIFKQTELDKEIWNLRLYGFRGPEINGLLLC